MEIEDGSTGVDEETLRKNRAYIRYLLGQLALVHEGVDEHGLNRDFLKRYDGKDWTDRESLVIDLLNMGGQSDFCYFFQKDGKQFVQLCLGELKPTLSPEDPKFGAWWESADGLMVQAEAAKDENRPDEAFYLYEKAAKTGGAEAQFQCGSQYYHGEGTARDYAKALYWYEKAAEQGDAEAQSQCGVMYYHGEGTAAYKAKALYWYEKTARQVSADLRGFDEPYEPNVFDLLQCARMYYEGEGTAVDQAKALYWYEEAAQLNNAEAQFQCGRMYYYGEGTVADKARALYWFEKAAQQGYSGAGYQCGDMYYHGEGTMADKAKALTWYWKAIPVYFDQSPSKRDLTALLQLGDMYYNGEGTAVNKAKALHWYKEAAEWGVAGAQFQCGKMYYHGEGTAVVRALAKMWFQRAAAQSGDKEAQEKAKKALCEYFWLSPA